MKSPTRQNLICLSATWLILWIVFSFWIPTTVQYGDSGELVANALKLSLSHPPGFPLYHWLLHLFLKIPIGATPFARAAILSGFFMAGTIAITTVRLHWFGVLIAIFLAFNPILFREAVLPDVFALNAFLCAIAIRISLSRIPLNRRFIFFSVAFSLACTNHPSAIFLVPLFFGFYEERITWRQTLPGAISAFILIPSLYASLLLFDRKDLFVWPVRPGLLGFFKHALRVDYGSFQLSPLASQMNWFLNLRDFFFHSAFLWGLLVLFSFSNSNRINALVFKHKYLTASLLVYVVGFYSLANINPEGFGAFVLGRFHVFPILILAFLLVEFIREHGKLKWILIATAFIPAAIYLSTNQNRWKNDSILEELALNLRNMASVSKKECRAVLTSADSIWGAFNYVNTVQRDSKSPAVIAPGLFTLESYQNKIADAGFAVHFRKTESGEPFDIERDFLIPNIARCDFLTLDMYPATSEIKVTFLPVGRLLSTESPQKPFPELKIRTKPDFMFGGGYSLAKKFYGYYALLPLSQGLTAARANNWLRAAAEFTHAHEIAPFLIPPMNNLCAALKKLNRNPEQCEKELRTIIEQEYPYL